MCEVSNYCHYKRQSLQEKVVGGHKADCCRGPIATDKHTAVSSGGDTVAFFFVV